MIKYILFFHLEVETSNLLISQGEDFSILYAFGLGSNMLLVSCDACLSDIIQGTLDQI